MNKYYKVNIYTHLQKQDHIKNFHEISLKQYIWKFLSGHIIQCSNVVCNLFNQFNYKILCTYNLFNPSPNYSHKNNLN